MRSRRAVIGACVAAVSGFAVLVAGFTAGLDALARSSAEAAAGDDRTPRLPERIHNAPARLRSTGAGGPAGPVSMAYRGTEARDGLFGSRDFPWIAISAVTGDYRVLSAPHLPRPGQGQVAVCPSGDRMAWAWDGGIAVYHTRRDETTKITEGVEGVGRALRWSTDCERVLFFSAGIHVLDVGSNEPVDAGPDLRPSRPSTLQWAPDNESVSYVDGTALVTVDVESPRSTRTDLGLENITALAWHPEGNRLVVMQSLSTGNRLFVYDISAAGAPRESISPTGVNVRQLLGWGGDGTVAVVATFVESGPVQAIRLIDVSDRSHREITALPSRGENWTDSSTLSVAATPVANPGIRLEEPGWPWDLRARLVAAMLLTFFPLAYYLVLPPVLARRRSGTHH